MIYGYARVSSKEQNEQRQVIALMDAGVEDYNIFVDKESGKDFDRSGYKYMVRRLKKGDVVFVKSIDRFGRNYQEVQNEWRRLTEKGVDIKVLDMPLLDTTKNKDLIGTLISDIVLQLLSYVAETERTNIKQRQAEGIKAAKARGVKFGRPQKWIWQNYIDIFDRYRQKEFSQEEARQEISKKLTNRSFYRMYREYKKNVTCEIELGE